jgi:hypothetical protein
MILRMNHALLFFLHSIASEWIWAKDFERRFIFQVSIATSRMWKTSTDINLAKYMDTQQCTAHTRFEVILMPIEKTSFNRTTQPL